MKKLALIAVVVFTTLTIQSCREADDVLSPDEMATLQRVKDSSDQINNLNTVNNEQAGNTTSNLDGEIAPPPKK